ncbi:unnamed protein product [Acanthoscelides obtectus]|uniref:Uncharacterized protein n=1 Tax=Acanthoscelides obtectus TaxID=200917 RepID=A0A9P0P0T6_ACAOB|nr:unnamed protein product [Acanthoscelides obtectus]CAK1646997.1 hypothetical protein AOBTE_LOCUS14996 [Acanthoscelides obtectus]
MTISDIIDKQISVKFVGAGWITCAIGRGHGTKQLHCQKQKGFLQFSIGFFRHTLHFEALYICTRYPW